MEILFQWIAATFFFFTPAYLANLSCPFAKYFLPTIPISSHWLGDHKTWGGFTLALVIGTLSGFLIQFLPYLEFITINHYIFGFLSAFGAMLGDSIKSFIKRRLKILPGKPWIPFDQIDFIIGALIMVSILQPIPGYIIIFGLLMTPILHLLTNIAAYKLKIKDVWY